MNKRIVEEDIKELISDEQIELLKSLIGKKVSSFEYSSMTSESGVLNMCPNDIIYNVILFTDDNTYWVDDIYQETKAFEGYSGVYNSTLFIERIDTPDRILTFDHITDNINSNIVDIKIIKNEHHTIPFGIEGVDILKHVREDTILIQFENGESRVICATDSDGTFMEYYKNKSIWENSEKEIYDHEMDKKEKEQLLYRISYLSFDRKEEEVVYERAYKA